MKCNNCHKEVKWLKSHNKLVNADNMTSHVCPKKRKMVYCPLHDKSFNINSPCTHYVELNYQVGENEQFFIKKIKQNQFKPKIEQVTNVTPMYAPKIKKPTRRELQSNNTLTNWFNQDNFKPVLEGF